MRPTLTLPDLSSSRLRGLPRQAGSAYILTLLALVILTIVGLSLSLITQTERQLGVNERITQRVFYAANSGTAAATARVLAQNNHESMQFLLNQGQAAGGLNTAERITTSRFHPLLSSPCDFCEINQGSQFFDVHHAITASGERIGWTGVGPPPEDLQPLARKTVAEMVSLQPWRVSIQADVLPSLESDELDKIKF